MLTSNVTMLKDKEDNSIKKAIENGFPIGTISQLAEAESWRKEIYRPIYYLHKWWARRLGSVFRAIILASCIGQDEDVEQLFYRKVKFPDVVIFDPFMGSGTTIGEAVKLGCRVIGRDINPVATTMVTAALQRYSRTEVKQVFQSLQNTLSLQIQSFYKTRLPTGQQADILYYFWVKTVPCPLCNCEVELFKSRIFAKHAIPKKYPKAKSICPECNAINDVKYNDKMAQCYHCDSAYNPQSGNVKKARAVCLSCQAEFKIVEAVRRLNGPPTHKMYAKLVLTNEGEKIYLPIDEYDHESYRRAEILLKKLWHYIPQVQITPGYNTNQVLNYNYTYWHQMFNTRQLACIALLISEIQKITTPELKTLFASLLSGTLEFNNMFCSFKGEGTGAVRHMFSHHILKPEFAPLEANLWGTPKSSGSFSTLFKSRILRALDYKDKPFELKLATSNGKRHSNKVFHIGSQLNKDITNDYKDFVGSDSVYLSCGDSAKTDLPDQSVDLVITDPPFFDNVHYSQLADFFYVWLRQILDGNSYFKLSTTRSTQEVQDTEIETFTSKLTSVFSECQRVLKNNGLLVFTYHHSRIEGWVSIYEAVRKAGFHITHTHPVKAEMAVSVPIQQSKVPVQFDLIIVCRKDSPPASQTKSNSFLLSTCIGETKSIVNKLQEVSINVSLGDIKVILMGCILSKLSTLNNISEEISTIYKVEKEADQLVKSLASEVKSNRTEARATQLSIFD